jgi:cytochrome c peroxidase
VQCGRPGAFTDENDAGRSGKKVADIAAFTTPDIRNVLVTGPYFHDGSMETLWDIIDHYNKGDGLQDPYSRRRYPAPRLDRTGDRRSPSIGVRHEQDGHTYTSRL